MSPHRPFRLVLAALGGLLATATVAVAPAVAQPTARAAGDVRSCGNVVFTPASEDGAFDIRARDTSCRTARRVARASRTRDVTGPYRYRARGFRCRGRRVDEGLPQVRWRCTRRSALVTFTRS